MQLRLSFAAFPALLLALTACGGGSGSSATPAPTAPTVTLNYGVKQLQFSWNAVSGASSYRLLEDPDGASGYSQVGGDLTANSVTHDITLYRRLNARYIVEACNSGGCTGSAPMALATNLVPAIGYVKASNPDADDNFGTSLALSADGTTLAVGAPYEASNATGINGLQSDNSATYCGAVYLFARTAGTWSQQAYIKAVNAEAGDQFGMTVALSADGNTLAVGASNESSAATGINGDPGDNSASGAGAAYVFTRNGTTWAQQAYVKASNTEAGDMFGRAVAIAADGATLAVSAPGEGSAATGIDGNQADNTLNNSGAVYVFTQTGGVWSQQDYVKASNTGAADYFGWSLALAADGNTLAAGAFQEASSATGIDGNQGDNATFGAGAAYVFSRSGGTWTQQAYVKASNTATSANFGIAVALAGDGDTLAVGAYGEDSAATGINSDPGNVYLNNAGAAYVFSRSAGAWSQQAYIKASNAGANNYFGGAVALTADGNTLAVGASNESSAATGIGGDQSDTSLSGSGAAYVFRRTGGAWSQQAYVKASNTGDSDAFGFALAFSADDTTLAAGAAYEASAASGVGGDQADNSASNAGAVYLY